MPKVAIELRSKTLMWVSQEQAHVIDRAWESKALVTVNGAKINTTDIVGMYPEKLYYELHPEKKPVETKPFAPLIAEPVKPDVKGEGYKKFKEAGLKLKRKLKATDLKGN